MLHSELCAICSGGSIDELQSAIEEIKNEFKVNPIDENDCIQLVNQNDGLILELASTSHVDTIKKVLLLLELGVNPQSQKGQWFSKVFITLPFDKMCHYFDLTFPMINNKINLEQFVKIYPHSQEDRNNLFTINRHYIPNTLNDRNIKKELQYFLFLISKNYPLTLEQLLDLNHEEYKLLKKYKLLNNYISFAVSHLNNTQEEYTEIKLINVLKEKFNHFPYKVDQETKIKIKNGELFQIPDAIISPQTLNAILKIAPKLIDYNIMDINKLLLLDKSKVNQIFKHQKYFSNFETAYAIKNFFDYNIPIRKHVINWFKKMDIHPNLYAQIFSKNINIDKIIVNKIYTNSNMSDDEKYNLFDKLSFIAHFNNKPKSLSLIRRKRNLSKESIRLTQLLYKKQYTLENKQNNLKQYNQVVNKIKKYSNKYNFNSEGGINYFLILSSQNEELINYLLTNQIIDTNKQNLQHAIHHLNKTSLEYFIKNKVLLNKEDWTYKQITHFFNNDTVYVEEVSMILNNYSDSIIDWLNIHTDLTRTSLSITLNSQMMNKVFKQFLNQNFFKIKNKELSYHIFPYSLLYDTYSSSIKKIDYLLSEAPPQKRYSTSFTYNHFVDSYKIESIKIFEYLLEKNIINPGNIIWFKETNTKHIVSKEEKELLNYFAFFILKNHNNQSNFITYLIAHELFEIYNSNVNEKEIDFYQILESKLNMLNFFSVTNHFVVFVVNKVLEYQPEKLKQLHDLALKNNHLEKGRFLLSILESLQEKQKILTQLNQNETIIVKKTKKI